MRQVMDLKVKMSNRSLFPEGKRASCFLDTGVHGKVCNETENT